LTKYEKLLAKWRNNPRNVRFSEIDAILRRYGYTPKQPRGGSSHFVYRKPGRYPITVVYRKPFVHSRAVKNVLRAIEESIDQE
jgi:hypothetical protein